MPDFAFLGENLAVDLLNTVVAADGRRVDLLAGGGDVAAWSEAVGVLPPGAWVSAPTPGEPASLRRFRERLRRGLGDWARTGRVSPDFLKVLNDALARDPERPVLRRSRAGGLELRRVSTGDPRGRLYAAVARAAAALLTGGDRRRLRRCANPECVLRFYDVSKAGRRRWCSMRTCGGRAKARAFYARVKTS